MSVKEGVMHCTMRYAVCSLKAPRVDCLKAVPLPLVRVGVLEVVVILTLAHGLASP